MQTGKCLQYEGSRVFLGKCNGGKNQEWGTRKYTTVSGTTIHNNPNLVFTPNTPNQRCLAAEYRTANKTYIFTFQNCGGNIFQEWIIDNEKNVLLSFYNLRTNNNRTLLDLDKDENIIVSGNEGPSSKWQLID